MSLAISRLVGLAVAVCILSLCRAAPGVNRNYVLKRSKGAVSAFCLAGSSKPATVANAETIIIGTAAKVPGRGRSCSSKPIVAFFPKGTRSKARKLQEDTSVAIEAPVILQAAPSLIMTTSFEVSVWAADQGDTVTFTATNEVPQRTLSVEGAPEDINLAAAAGAAAGSTVTILTEVPVSEFTSAAELLLPQAESYLAWFFSTYPNSKGLQAAVLLVPDTADADGSLTDAGYFLFQEETEETITGFMFFATFDSLEASAAAAAAAIGQVASPGGAARRLLSARDYSRRLLQYDGGEDQAGSRPCRANCVRIGNSPPFRWNCRCAQ